MGNPIFIRTSEGVLLRFEEASVARRWIESGRIQWSDRFLGTDQAWHPLTDLLDFSQAGRAGSATPPAFPAGGVPVREAARDPAGVPPPGPEDLRRTAEWVSPALEPVPRAPEPVASPTERISGAPVPSRDANVVQPASKTDSAPASPGDGPTRSQQGEAAAPLAEVVEGEWWASDPGGSRTFPVRRVLLVAVLLVAVAGALVFWWTGRPGQDLGVASPDRSDEVLVGGAGDPGVTDPVLARERASEGPDAQVGGQDEGAPAEDPGASPKDAIPTGTEAMRRVAPEPVEPEAGPGTRLASLPEPREGRRVDPSPPEEPDTYDAHMEAGNRLMTTRPDAAMAHFRRAAQLRPARVEPLSRMGDLAMQQQDLEGAERFYREALRRNADYGPTMLGIARLRHRKGNRDDARYWYTRYLERFPQGSGAAEARTYLEAR